MSDQSAQLYSDYWAAFDDPAPLLYMMDLTEDQQVALLQSALASGQPINPEEIEGELVDGETFY